jgi:hypothetical protein
MRGMRAFCQLLYEPLYVRNLYIQAPGVVHGPITVETLKALECS